MQWWVLDHGQDDYFVYNDFIPELDRWCFPDEPHNARVRMWLSAFEDIRSRYIVGYAFTAQPSSTSICSALRMAVLRTGRAPQYGLLDRGKDMKKVGLEKPRLSAEGQGALLRLIRSQWGNSGGTIFSIGEHPESKPIESWFKTKRNMLDTMASSYCGNKPANRPDRAHEMEKEHDEFLAGKREVTPLPPASLAIAATVYWIEQKYNREHHHSGHGMGGRTPEQVFRAGYSLAAQEAAARLLNRRELDEFLWDRQERVVGRGGCVQMYGAQYEPADPASQGALIVWTSRRVMVAADPHNIGDAVAIDPDTGEFVAALVCRKFTAWGASQETIRAEMRKQRSVTRAARQFLEFLGQHGGPRGHFDFLGDEWIRKTGTYDAKAALPAGAAPGRSAVASPQRALAPACVSDGIEEDADTFKNIELED
jgi:transposase InsO family protein